MKEMKTTKWNWFSVKLIFESIISGEPDFIDSNYSDSNKYFNESVIIVKAQSFEHAYKLSERKAHNMEIEYTNPYGQNIHLKFIEAIDCYLIGEEALNSGTEVYWRLIKASKDMDTEVFIDRYYPETIVENTNLSNHSILLNGEFTS